MDQVEKVQALDDTIGYKPVSSFATPSWRDRSRSYSRQYEILDEADDDPELKSAIIEKLGED